MVGSSATDGRSLRLLRQPVVEENGVLKHWVDALADWLEERLRSRGKDVYVFNGGLSVSGLQHVGRLRGEVILPEVLRRILESRGFKIRQYITLYTQDEWKGKKEQLSQFPDASEACKYRGWPLARVPDPAGCHKSWVDHYWMDFGPYISEFTDGRIEVVTTTELYQGKLREFTVMAIERREQLRKVINKYRGRKPYPEGWIPFQPVCAKCGRIDSTEAVSVNLREEVVEYVCHNCGYRGVAKLSEGKLSWRVEWVGVWWALGVDFEPYGKDHAAPGGSRDSACDIAVNVFGVEPPEGIPYEWVAVRHDGEEVDMTSSGFAGFTPREWLEVAHAEVLRFIYLKTPPMRKIVLSLKEIPQYYTMYYKAERVYYGAEKVEDKAEELLLKRSYELSYVRGAPPEKMPAQPPYTHVAILAQLVPSSMWPEEPLRRLQRSGHMPEKPTSFDIERLRSLLPRALKWVGKYGPPHLRVRLVEELGKDIVERIPDWVRDTFKRVAGMLEKLEVWDEESIKKVLVEAGREWSPAKRREFYRYFYLVFVGEEKGPRAAPLLALLERDWVIRRLLEAAGG